MLNLFSVFGRVEGTHWFDESHLKLKNTSSRFSAISHWMTVSWLELTTIKGTKIYPVDRIPDYVTRHANDRYKRYKQSWVSGD